jgi:hypothetical protein
MLQKDSPSWHLALSVARGLIANDEPPSVDVTAPLTRARHRR